MAVIRYIEEAIINDPGRKMVFVGGPRQMGKTIMSHTLAKHMWPHVEYFNWDIIEDQPIILNKAGLHDSDLIIFDELHKYDQTQAF